VSSELSVAKVLANLEAQMTLHRESEAYHAQQEVFHREQRALHAAGLEAVTKHFEAFQAASGGAAEIAGRVEAASQSAAQAAAQAAAAKAVEAVEPWRPGKRPQPAPLVIRLIEELQAGQVFGPSWIAAEVNRRFSRALPKPLDVRLASAVLRRLVDSGWVRVVKEGGPHHEAGYTRV
jgi:hypothetical protein